MVNKHNLLTIELRTDYQLENKSSCVELESAWVYQECTEGWELVS